MPRRPLLVALASLTLRKRMWLEVHWQLQAYVLSQALKGLLLFLRELQRLVLELPRIAGPRDKLFLFVPQCIEHLVGHGLYLLHLCSK